MFIILHKTSWILSSIKSYVSKAFIIFLESIVLHLSKLISKAFTYIFVVDFVAKHGFSYLFFVNFMAKWTEMY